MANFDWTCPYCGRHATITDQSVTGDTAYLTIKNAEGDRGLNAVFVVCPNPKCKKFTLTARLFKSEWRQNKGQVLIGDPLTTWNLLPASRAQSFPDYVPTAIRDDYNEACLIVTPSPKASATLARRCLQGLIRDFWKVKPGKLVNEIAEIKDKVDPATWDAIEAVRKVGNIGAHMEADINVIVDVDSGEAELLIELIEMLIRDWYIARAERGERLRAIADMAKQKAALKKAP